MCCNEALLLLCAYSVDWIAGNFPSRDSPSKPSPASVTNDSRWKERYTLVADVKRILHFLISPCDTIDPYIHVSDDFHLFSVGLIYHCFNRACWETLRRRDDRYVPRLWQTSRFPPKNLLRCGLALRKLNNFLQE